jgi:hypothetical protein
MTDEQPQLIELAEELESVLLLLSYGAYRLQVSAALSLLVDHYHDELPAEVRDLALETLRLLDPAMTVDVAAVEKARKAWRVIRDDISFVPSRNVFALCTAFSLVGVQLSSENRSIGLALPAALVLNTVKPVAPELVDIDLDSHLTLADPFDPDVQMLYRLIASAKDALKREQQT